MAFLDCSIGLPLIEPEQSSTKTSSTGLALEVTGFGRRHEHQAEDAGAVAVVVGDHAAADIAGGDLVAEHEVLVGNRVGGREADGCAGGVGAIDLDHVRARRDATDGHARVDLDGQVDVVPAALVGGEVTNLRGLAGRARVAAARRGTDAVGRSGRVEAGADDHREHELPRVVVVAERLEVGDVDVDGLAGLDVGDLLREDVRALLRHERGDVALGASVRVDLLGFFAFADDAADRPVADGHEELVDRAVLRQREDVDRFDLGVEGVVEALLHADRADVAADVRADLGVFERDRDLLGLAGDDADKAAGAGVVGRERTRAGLSGVGRARDDPELFAGSVDEGGGSGLRLSTSATTGAPPGLPHTLRP